MKYFRDETECPYRAVCTNKEECGSNCYKLRRLNILFDKSNIPKRYSQPLTLFPEDCDLKAYQWLNEIKNNFDEFVNEGRQLFISSSENINNCNLWAIKMMQMFIHFTWEQYTEHRRSIYVDTPEFVQELINSVGYTFEDKDSLKEYKEELEKADLVVWDNFDCDSYKPYIREQLTVIAKKRFKNNKANIFTTKSSGNYLGTKIGVDLHNVMNKEPHINLFGKEDALNDRNTNN